MWSGQRLQSILLMLLCRPQLPTLNSQVPQGVSPSLLRPRWLICLLGRASWQLRNLFMLLAMVESEVLSTKVFLLP